MNKERELLKQAQEMINELMTAGDNEACALHDSIRDYLAYPVDESSGIYDVLNKPIKTEVINGLTLEYDFLGGIDIKINDFVYVHVNYDYRYTHNSARKYLAEQIARLISECKQDLATSSVSEHNAAQLKKIVLSELLLASKLALGLLKDFFKASLGAGTIKKLENAIIKMESL